MEVSIYLGGCPETCIATREWIVRDYHTEEVIGAFSTMGLAKAWLKYMGNTRKVTYERVLSWYETTDG